MINSLRKTTFWLLLFVGIVVFGVVSCAKPELIGGDLLEDETSQVGFTDTISLHCSHRIEDAVLTYSGENGRQITRNLVGKLNDPFFGKTEASCYTEIYLFNGSSAFLEKTIDSVVAAFRYDTNGLYGDIHQPVTLSVHLLTEELDPEMDLYSDEAPFFELNPIAEATIVPSPYDSIYIQSRGDSVHLPPMVRMPLSQEFIQTMMAQDSSTFEAADSFRLWIKGLHVKASIVENTMLSFDLRSLYSSITIYYRGATDTISSEISFTFTDGLGAGIHHTHFEHDYTGSEAQKFLDDPSLSDSLLFVQGMSGLAVGVALPGLPNISDILINKAELEFYAAEIPGDNLTFYPRARQLINTIENDEHHLDFSEDVSIALRQFGVLDFFGGELMDTDTLGVSPKKYVMNVTTSLQDIYKGNIDNQFFVTPFLKPNIPNRVILYGPAHPTYPARLRLTYTVVR